MTAFAPIPRDMPPPRSKMWGEWPRAALGVGRLALSGKRLADAPRGDGRGVLVLPGMFNGDLSNVALRRYLDTLGYRSYRWELGRNCGTRAIGMDGERLVERIEAIVAETGGPITVIGISLGGIMARLMAHRRPDLVRSVVTIVSPYAGPATATNVWRSFEWYTGQKISDPAVIAMAEEVARPLPCPSTAIWSPSDGLVNGWNCHSEDEAGCRAVRIDTSHVGAQMNPDVLRIVAEALATEGQD